MKKAIQFLGVMLAILPALSFGQAKKTTWPEMKSFHTVMAATFHPAEEGNFADHFLDQIGRGVRTDHNNHEKSKSYQGHPEGATGQHRNCVLFQ